MAWLASFLVFILLGGGLFGLAVVRRKLRDDTAAVRELPPDILISIARAHDADLAGRSTDDRKT